MTNRASVVDHQRQPWLINQTHRLPSATPYLARLASAQWTHRLKRLIISYTEIYNSLHAKFSTRSRPTDIITFGSCVILLQLWPARYSEIRSILEVRSLVKLAVRYSRSKKFMQSRASRSSTSTLSLRI